MACRSLSYEITGGRGGCEDPHGPAGAHARRREHYPFARRRPGSVSGFGNGLAEAQDSEV